MDGDRSHRGGVHRQDERDEQERRRHLGRRGELVGVRADGRLLGMAGARRVEDRAGELPVVEVVGETARLRPVAGALGGAVGMDHGHAVAVLEVLGAGSAGHGQEYAEGV
jgi:hypothetical protein